MEGIQEFIKRAKNNKISLIHCEQGKGINLRARFNDGDEKQNVYEAFNIPTISHIRDYPHNTWLLDDIPAIGSTTYLFHADKYGPEIASKMGAPQEQNFYAPHVYLDYNYDPLKDYTPLKDRHHNFIYIGSYKNPKNERDLFLSKYKEYMQFYDLLVDAFMDEYHTPHHRIAEDVLKDKDIDINYKDTGYLLLTILTNRHVRFERRKRLFYKMLAYPIEIIWSGDMLSPTNHGNVKANINYNGVTLDKSFKMMEQSKAMLMTLNSFSDCLSERMLTCMHRGCGVISQGNQLIDDTFQHEQDILRLDDNLANFDDIMEQAQDPGLLKEITKNAYEKVKDEYSPEYRVNQIFEVLESKGVLQDE